MSIDDDLNRVDAHLNSDAPRLSQLNPPGFEQTIFTVPDLPADPFVLVPEDAGDEMEGPYSGDEFVPEPESNVMVRQAPGEAPLYLRVLVQDGNEIQTVDGLGNEHTYRITPVMDNTLPAQNADLTDAQREQARSQGIET